MIYLACLLLSLVSLLTVFYADLKSDLSGYVTTRVESFDRLLGTAVNELNQLSTIKAVDCSGPAIEALVRASMNSAIVRHFYLLPAGGTRACSPLTLIDDVAAKQLTAQGRLLGSPLIGQVSVLVLPGANGDFVVVHHPKSVAIVQDGTSIGNHQILAAQVPGTLIRDLLRLRETNGAIIRIDTWAGTNLLDTGWDDSAGARGWGDLIRIQQDSTVLPLTVSARISISNAVAGAVRHALASFLLAALLTILLIGQINQWLRRSANPLTRLNRALRNGNSNPSFSRLLIAIPALVLAAKYSCAGGIRSAEYCRQWSSSTWPNVMV